MKHKTKAAIAVLGVIFIALVGLRNQKPTRIASHPVPARIEATVSLAPVFEQSAPTKSVSELPTASGVIRKTVSQVETLRTPAIAERPYIRFRLSQAGTLEGVFATRCETVKQARYIEATDGFYYRVVSPATGETIIDGTIAKPITRLPYHGHDAKGNEFVECIEEPSDSPALFDIPNVQGRLEIYATDRKSVLDTKSLALVRAVNLAPL